MMEKMTHEELVERHTDLVVELLAKQHEKDISAYDYGETAYGRAAEAIRDLLAYIKEYTAE